MTNNKTSANKFVNLSDEEKKAYNRKRKAESRARARVELKEGKAPLTEAFAKELLADAAMLILATDAPGSKQIRTYLEGAYGDKGGATINLLSKIKRGKMKPKHINLVMQNTKK